VGKGKGGVRPGLFNCAGLASHQPTDGNDTSLVTLCKGLETKNLETFCKYLLSAHIYVVADCTLRHAPKVSPARVLHKHSRPHRDYELLLWQVEGVTEHLDDDVWQDEEAESPYQGKK
jgi:hypothetical protein